MKRDRARLARRALLALLVVVSGAVAWSLRRPPPPAGTAGSPGETPPGQGTTMAEGELLQFREGKRKVGVRWRSMAGREGDAMRLQGVEVTLPFVTDGREATATITADEGLYDASSQRVAFRGNVRVTTGDGLELESETLKYWGDRDRVFTRDPVRFRRGRTSGSATGLEYRSEGGRLDLGADVKLRLEEEAGPPTLIEAASARASRPERLVFFEGGTVVTQGARELRSDRLQALFTSDLQALQRAVATEDVDLRVGPGAPLPGTSGVPEGGEKRLRCRRLHLVFAEKGVLEEVIAVNPATLEVQPGPRDPPERRRLESDVMRFGFDGEGRLVSLHAHGSRARARRTVLTLEPVGPRGDPARRVESDALAATLDPASAAVSTATFTGNVAFAEPGRRAWAQRAEYEAHRGRLALTGEPRVAEEADGSELRGGLIELATRSRGLSATGSVRHTVRGKGAGARPGMLGGEEPTVLVCRRFEYDPASRTARYRENALLRSGRDEVRAPLIVIEDAGEGRGRLSASGGTSSLLHPRARGAAAGEPEPVEARSREMVYEEAAGRIVYTGEVEIRQGDIVTRSPEAVVTLSKEGAVDRLLAGEPVEVVQGERRASGDRGTYTPADETFVLVGDKVVLTDADRRIEGRVLTFVVGSDRIRVDGREEARTEAVFRRKEPGKP
jgi:LPS export ABC transporter protein LptC/lipopolysaccharide transport protein LptA